MPTVFLPLTPNARHELLPEAGARHERTLAAVACMPRFGGWFAPQSDTMLWRVEPP